MEPMNYAPITDWSDDDLLKEYRTSGADRPEVTEEILRRGLELPGDPEAAEVAAVEWDGEGQEGDPGSGALPTPF